MSGYPKTKEEWWTALDKNWSDILAMLHRWIGMNDYEDIDGNITQEVRAVEINKMKDNKDPRLVRYLNGAWSNAPDVAGIWEIKGWNELCDLCSEEHVLYDKEKE